MSETRLYGILVTPGGSIRKKDVWDVACSAHHSFVVANGWHPGGGDEWEGVKVGRWASKQRALKRSGDLAQDKVEKLDMMGFMWDIEAARRKKMCDVYVSFVRATGRPPEAHERWRGLDVGGWAQRQRRERREGKMGRDVIRDLDEIGFSWESDKERQWQVAFDAYRAFVSSVGREPVRGDMQGEIPVGVWATNQRINFGLGVLKNKEHVAKLEAMGFQRGQTSLVPHAERWERSLAAYSSFVAANGRAPRRIESWEGINVGKWACTQRECRRQFKGMSKERVRKLEEIGFRW